MFTILIGSFQTVPYQDETSFISNGLEPPNSERVAAEAQPEISDYTTPTMN